MQAVYASEASELLQLKDVNPGLSLYANYLLFHIDPGLSVYHRMMGNGNINNAGEANLTELSGWIL